MIKSLDNPCKCGSVYIVNKRYNLCYECNFQRLHDGKSSIWVAIEKDRQKKKFYKKTGEWDLFMEIWNEREHKCHNCKDKLGDIPKPIYFMHMKPKGLYPELRLKKSNIELGCSICHSFYDHGDKQKYYNRKDLNL